MPEVEARNIVEKFFNTVHGMLDGPVVWFRGIYRFIHFNTEI